MGKTTVYCAVKGPDGKFRQVYKKEVGGRKGPAPNTAKAPAKKRAPSRASRLKKIESLKAEYAAVGKPAKAPKAKKPRAPLTQAQLKALADGRAKRAAMRSGIPPPLPPGRPPKPLPPTPSGPPPLMPLAPKPATYLKSTGLGSAVSSTTMV